jgi:hypothetical protein
MYCQVGVRDSLDHPKACALAQRAAAAVNARGYAAAMASPGTWLRGGPGEAAGLCELELARRKSKRVYEGSFQARGWWARQ